MADTRTSTHGWPRVIFLALAVLTVIMTWRAVVASTPATIEAHPVQSTLLWLAVAAWWLGTAGVIHNGRRMRRAAYTAWVINLVCPFVALAARFEAMSTVSPWYGGGSAYYFVPTVAALAALLWLVWSSPARIATRNGG